MKNLYWWLCKIKRLGVNIEYMERNRLRGPWKPNRKKEKIKSRKYLH